MVKLNIIPFIVRTADVGFKIAAVVERRIYRMEGYQERKIAALELKDIKGRVILRKREVPVINAW